MHIVEVISLSRKMPFESLLYSTHTNMQPGDLVDAPFQDSSIYALVIGVHPVASVRTILRTLSYRIKDGLEIITHQWIPEHLLNKLLHHARTNSIPLNDFFQLLWHENSLLFDSSLSDTSLNLDSVMGPLEARATNYRRLPHSIIVCPSVRHATALARHIPNSTTITTKPGLEKYRSRRDNLSTIIIPNSLFSAIINVLPNDITIVFDGYLSDQFQRRSQAGTFFNHSALYINICLWLGKSVVLGDELLYFGDWQYLWKKQASFTVRAPIIPSEATQVKYKKNKNLEDYQLSELSKIYNQGKKILIYCNQRDLYGYISCPKCQYIERCPTCNAILRLTLTEKHPALLCVTCNSHSRARDICQSCGGITLETRRQGIDGYAHKLSEINSSIPIFKLSKDTKHQARVIAEWNNHGGILIATKQLLTYTEFTTDICYASPHSWTHSPGTPEEHYYEYLWLLDRCKSFVSLPITREILTKGTNSDEIDMVCLAHQEVISSHALGTKLPCTIL